MSTREPNLWITITAIAAIALMVSSATLCGIDDTLIKFGIAVIAGLGGFSLATLVRKD